MLQIFFNFVKRLGKQRRDADHYAASAAEQQARWLRDPLSHPDLQRMSQRELADLPLGAWARRCE